MCAMLDVRAGAIPTFGFRARAPQANGKFDRTEVDMRLADLLIEAKLTESDYQKAPKTPVYAYRDFSEVFDEEELPQTESDFLSYQLIPAFWPLTHPVAPSACSPTRGGQS